MTEPIDAARRSFAIFVSLQLGGVWLNRHENRFRNIILHFLVIIMSYYLVSPLAKYSC